MCITLLSPIYKLVHCTWRMGQLVTKSMMKQIVNFFAMLQSAMMKQIVKFFAMLQSALELAQEVASAWLSPLELAACLHLASFDIHLSLHSVHCEPDYCWCSLSTEPSFHEMPPIAMALISLLLALLDWHVPPITCRILTAMCMHVLRMDSACTFVALLLPTFGKRPQDQRNTSRKRATTTSPATEQTGDDATTPTTEPVALSQPTEISQSSASTDPMHVPVLPIVVETEASMPVDDIVTELALQQTEDAQAVTSAVRIIQEGKQSEIRKLCQPWGVPLREKKASGKQGNRPDHILKQELKIVLTKRTIQLKNQSGNSKRDVKDATSPGGTATEHARADFAFEDAVADALQRIKASSPNL